MGCPGEEESLLPIFPGDLCFPCGWAQSLSGQGSGPQMKGHTYPQEDIPHLGFLEKIPAFISQHVPGQHTTCLLCYLSPQSSGKQ